MEPRADNRGMRRVANHVVAILFVLAAAACGPFDDGNGSPSTPATHSPTQAPTAVATPDVAVPMQAVVWATAAKPDRGGPERNLSEIPADAKTVYAFAQAGTIPAGSVLEAQWTINGEDVPGLTGIALIPEELPAGWIEFHLTWNAPQPLPHGTLAVTIIANGRVATTGSITIAQP